jgi:hypothetical protein
MDDDFRRLAGRGPVDDRAGNLRLLVHQGEGFRSVVHWKVTHYHEPKSVELQGRAKGGIRISVALKVATDDPGSVFTSGPISMC